MKFVASVLLSLVASSSITIVSSDNVATAASNNVRQSLTLEDRFHQWRKEHSKVYESTNEMLFRMEIWMDNHEYIERHNGQRPTPSYTLGHNQFSDMTVDEYQRYNKLGMYSPGIVLDRLPKEDNEDVGFVTLDELNAVPKRHLEEESEDDITKPLPDEIDWVAAGAVVPVKNQGMCGSCWAFSAICSIEGAHFLDTGSLIALSEQELLDCDKLDMGCNGGLMDNAFLFDENSTGICSEDDYPYAGRKHWIKGCEAVKGECDGVEHTRVKRFIDIKNTEQAMMRALTHQPVSVAIEADQRSFQLYKEGVYDDPECGNRLDHGVAAVGYGTTDDSQDYFVVRNSWGATWGDNGYIKMSRKSDNVNGTCGILSWGSRPILRDDE